MPFLLFHANDDIVAWHYFWLGDDAYEPELTRLWVDWASTAATVLDVGAYTGLMSLLAALINPECHVHAIEPVERTVERLRINLRVNGVLDRVTTHARAASDEFGVEMINYYREENFLGTGSSIHDKGKRIFARRMIQMVNLDLYLGSTNRFDLIKIDVEGFEPAVLKGLSSVLARDKPRLLLEVWRENDGSVFERLRTLGYQWQVCGADIGRVRNFACTPIEPRAN